MIEITRKKNRLEVRMMAMNMGSDLCVMLMGGDKPHLGAVTVGSGSESLKTFAFDTHKENIITELFSSRLKREYTGNFAVCCGIHLNNISQEEIQLVIQLCRDMAEDLCAVLKNIAG